MGDARPRYTVWPAPAGSPPPFEMAGLLGGPRSPPFSRGPPLYSYNRFIGCICLSWLEKKGANENRDVSVLPKFLHPRIWGGIRASVLLL